MLVAAMSEREATGELLKDLPALLRKSDRLDSNYRREVLKRTIFPVYMCYTWVSPRKNRWLLFYESRSRKEVGDLSRITMVAYADFIGRGYYAIMSTSTAGRRHWIIYPPHFFSRYAERFGLNLSGVDLIKRYFKKNCNYVFQEHDRIVSEISYTKEIHGSSEEGVACGVITAEGNFLFKTFISYEMCKGEQIEIFTKNNQIRQEIHEHE